MTDSYRLPHNIIKLRLPDGRVVSMIQDQSNGEGGAMGNYLESVEVWVDGEPDPVGHLSATASGLCEWSTRELVVPVT